MNAVTRAARPVLYAIPKAANEPGASAWRDYDNAMAIWSREPTQRHAQIVLAMMFTFLMVMDNGVEACCRAVAGSEVAKWLVRQQTDAVLGARPC